MAMAQKELILSGNARQRILRRFVFRSERERGAELAGGSLTVALFLQQQAEDIVGLEYRSFFRKAVTGKRQVSAECLNSAGEVASSSQQQAGGVKQNNAFMLRSSQALVHGGLHFFQPP